MKMSTAVCNTGRLAGVVLGIIVAGIGMAGCGKPEGAGGPPAGMAPEVAVITVTPEALTLSDELPGRVSAFLVAEVRPQVSGIVQKRLFEEGADVKAGDPLYQIDPALYEAALARAEANMDAIRLRAERYKELLAVKAVSQQDYDDISSGLKQAEAEVKSARVNSTYTTIPAPISGRIGRSSVTIGALATAYQPVPFTTIQQLDQVYVDAPQSSANLLRLRKNVANGNIKSDDANRAKVRLVLEDGTTYPQEGVLQFSDVTVDPSTGSFIFRMIFPNPDKVLLPGMFVRAIVQEGVSDKAILIPQQGVARDPKGNPLAMLVNAEGKVEPRPIVLERAIGDRWLVASGLNAGDQVIVEGLLRARPGTPVKAVPFVKVAPEQAPAAQPQPVEKQK